MGGETAKSASRKDRKSERNGIIAVELTIICMVASKFNKHLQDFPTFGLSD